MIDSYVLAGINNLTVCRTCTKEGMCEGERKDGMPHWGMPCKHYVNAITGEVPPICIALLKEQEK